jgi:anthranilate synthase component 1
MARSGKDYKARIIDMPEDRENYMEGVRKVREEIIKGNLLQGVLARRVYIETNIPALEAYRNLRSFNPSPYMFLVNCGSFQLLGSSPEVHVKVKGGRAILRPIAGTRKRGQNQQEEESLEKDLLSDEKEKAEHLMLVDLARNDLGRICQPGSVEVTESMVIEKYSHVMHIVSQVEGNLKPEKSGADAIRATFPAGTVSGAPKIKAIEVIDALEGPKRGFYAGVVGYMEPDGSLDTCITIRSALRHKDKLILQAGAGIVYDSDPEREYIETQNKLGALIKAVGLEV